MEIYTDKDMPIGFMDSGVGGLSVLREAMKIAPFEDYIYYGDSAHAPYGVKSVEEITRLTYDVVDKLLDMGIKGLAVACNTATSAAVRSLRGDYPDLPIVGIEPAIKPAVIDKDVKRVLVMATPMTIRQEKFNRLLSQYSDSKEVISVECGGLMEYVERGILEGAELEAYLSDKLTGYMNDEDTGIVLGCTHYPFLKETILKVLSSYKVKIFDSGYGTALELMRRLDTAHLLRDDKDRTGKVTILNSKEDERVIRLSEDLLYGRKS